MDNADGTGDGNTAARHLIRFCGSGKTTKTSLGSDDRVLWDAGDVIGVFSEQATQRDGSRVENVRIPLTGGAGTPTGTFGSSLAWGSGTHYFYAYYPFDEQAGKAVTSLNAVLDAQQVQTGPTSNHTGANDFMWAKTVVDPAGREEVPVSLSFSHPFAIVEVRLATSDPQLVGQRVSEITLTASEAVPLAGAFTIDLTADAPVPVFSAGAGQRVSLTLTPGQEGDFVLSASDTIRAWLVMNAVDLTGATVTVGMRVGERTLEFGKPGRKFLAQHLYVLALEPEAVIDLNADGVYANSYRVDKPLQRYRFDAKVQGNGRATTGIALNPLDPASVLVLWQEGEAADAVVADPVLLEDGSVEFATTSKVGGNAAIGVKDAAGNLIWSWHIWSCSYDPAAMDEVYINRSGRQFTMMGWNLGAVNDNKNDPGAYGLLYQWGRKDPFPGARNLDTEVGMDAFVNDNTIATTNDAAFPWGTVASTAATGTVGYAAGNPTTFLIPASGTDWMNTPDDNLWGDGVQKTIYDPCPKGYRVPPEDTWTRFTLSGGAETTADRFNVANFPQANAQGGLDFYISADGSGPVSFYPYIKYRLAVNGSLFNAFPVSYIWAASSATLYADCFDYEHTIVINPQAYTGRAYGFGVRCVKDE